MATLEESSAQFGSNDKAAGLIAAIGLISGEQTYTFELYKRLVLPLDGFVFWVKASILPVYPDQQGALYNKWPFNSKLFNAGVKEPVLTPLQQAAYSFNINGSFHVSQQLAQEEDTTYVSQAILFTTKTEVNHFASIANDEMYILTLANGSQIAFNSQANHYQLAGLWHYHGKAVYSTLASQIVNDLNQINTSLQIVSNSLPYWLALGTPSVPVYPSYLSPKNLTPPYVTADIRSTEAIGQSPTYSPNYSQDQLVTDQIHFTMFGLNNNAALDFQLAVLQNSELGNYGIMNMPVPIDEKQPQIEFQIIAQKKTMDLQVNYYQKRVRELARQVISQALIGLTPVPASFPTPIVV